jgi:amino acid adenylation domain-containing protein
VRAADGELSFAELQRASARLAGALRSRGVGRGDRVGVHLPRTTDLVVALLAVLRAGGVCVPMDPGYPGERLALIASDAALTLLVSDRGGITLPPGTACLAPDAGAGAPLPPVPATDPLDPAYVIYTSGSTGTPKGVEVSRGAAAALVAALDAADVYRAEPGVVGWNASVSFDASVQQWVRVCRGDTLVLLDEEQRTDAGRLAAAIDRYGITDLDLTPSHWQLLREQFTGRPVPRLFMGGEPIPERTWKELVALGIDALNLYGPSECTVDSTVARVSGALPHLGEAVPGMRVHLLDRDLNPVAGGATGELYVAGPQLALGYVRRPGLTAERFLPDPFSAEPGARMYRTGDLARRGPGGVLTFAGRADRQLKLRGYRIEPGEIEHALGRHAQVTGAAVRVHEAAPGEELLIGYVTATGAPAPSPTELLDHLRTMLPAHMVPARITVLDALPLTPSGKIDHQALPAPGAAEATGTAGSLDEQIAEVWRTVLGLEEIESTENFIRLGGHSLAALRVVHVLRRKLGVELQLRHLLDAEDLAGFTESVREAGRRGNAPRPALLGRRAVAR